MEGEGKGETLWMAEGAQTRVRKMQSFFSSSHVSNPALQVYRDRLFRAANLVLPERDKARGKKKKERRRRESEED